MKRSTAITQEQFDALRPSLGRLTLDAVAVARCILVERERPSEVAQRFGMSRQRVNGIVKRFLAAASQVPTGWRYVEVWLPSLEAEKVEALATELREKHLKKQTDKLKR